MNTHIRKISKSLKSDDMLLKRVSLKETSSKGDFHKSDNEIQTQKMKKKKDFLHLPSNVSIPKHITCINTYPNTSNVSIHTQTYKMYQYIPKHIKCINTFFPA